MMILNDFYFLEKNIILGLSEFLASTILEDEEEKFLKKIIQRSLFSDKIDFLIPETSLHRVG